jgi:hypothetical protein
MDCRRRFIREALTRIVKQLRLTVSYFYTAVDKAAELKYLIGLSSTLANETTGALIGGPSFGLSCDAEGLVSALRQTIGGFRRVRLFIQRYGSYPNEEL